MTEPGKLMTTEEAHLLETKPVVTQNSQNQLYFNPVALADLDSTVAKPTLFVAFEKLT